MTYCVEEDALGNPTARQLEKWRPPVIKTRDLLTSYSTTINTINTIIDVLVVINKQFVQLLQ